MKSIRCLQLPQLISRNGSFSFADLSNRRIDEPLNDVWCVRDRLERRTATTAPPVQQPCDHQHQDDQADGAHTPSCAQAQ